MHHELARRAAENLTQHVTGELTLHFGGGVMRLIDVGALLLVSAHQPCRGHDLEQLQHAGVADRLLLAERLVHLPYRTRALRPQDAQELELRGRGFLQSSFLHGKSLVRSSSYCQRRPSYLGLITIDAIGTRGTGSSVNIWLRGRAAL